MIAGQQRLRDGSVVTVQGAVGNNPASVDAKASIARPARADGVTRIDASKS